MEIKNKIEEELAGLGSDIKDVFENIRKAGTRGFRLSRNMCPLATYLDSKGLLRSAEISHYNIDKIWSEGRVYKLQLPRPVALFIQSFDAGRYSALELGFIEGLFVKARFYYRRLFHDWD